ncbi:MAG: hypothetical protein RKE49_09640 [Oceanicaulis sp.]
MTDPARFTVERRYAMAADAHFACILNYDELAEAMEGQVSYDGLPSGEARPGQAFEVKLKLFGWLPIGTWRIEVMLRDDKARRLESFECGGAVKAWRHVITVQPDGQGCVHRDALEIDAGWLTGFYARTARRMYEKRHDLRATLRGETS